MWLCRGRGSDCVLETVRVIFFFIKQKTAYEMRISDWSSDVCSSDLFCGARAEILALQHETHRDIPSPDPLDGFVHSCERHDIDDSRDAMLRREREHQIGRASCRERECQYV